MHKTKSARGELFLQLLCILLLIALLATMLVTEALRNARAVSRETATTAEYTYTDALFGYLFRNELAVQTENNGPIDYTFSNGATVTPGDTVARVWVDDIGADKRERAAALYAELERCKTALAEGEHTWQTDYVYDYATLMQELSAGKLQNGTADVAAVHGALSRGGAQDAQTAGELRARIDALNAELEALVEHVDAPEVLTTSLGGRFYKEADGYEATFGPAAAATLTPEKLEALLCEPQQTDHTVGKIVGEGSWYLALPVSAALAETYTLGQAYTVHFEGSDLVAPLTLERISCDRTGEQALLLLHGDTTLAAPDACRRQQVRIEKETVRGLRIPAAALMEENTVFVEESGVARRRKISPILTEQGCLLIAPCDEEGYLQEGERVLLSVRQIYDGKAVN